VHGLPDTKSSSRKQPVMTLATGWSSRVVQ
jgi:hypothetical protein